MKRTGFTLVEMLVVIGIISVLIAASVVGFSSVTASADKAKCTELVKNVHTALVQLYNKNNGIWPKALINGRSEGLLDRDAALPLASLLGLRTEKDANGRDVKLIGYDRLGILSPWAQQVVKNSANADIGTKVPTGGTVQDHILRYAIDTQAEGFITDANLSGCAKVRETAMVWCCGKDGKLEQDYSRGIRKDDVYSWRPGDVVE